MSIYIEAEPERPQLFDDSEEAPPIDPAVAPLADTLRSAYAMRVAAYHQELMGEFASQGEDSPDPPASAYPRVMLPGDNPEKPEDDQEEIVCDADLFTTLFDLYALDGWAPIARLEAALGAKAKIKSQPHNPSGGTPGGLTAYAAYSFFLYCRNMLALLIRESLMDIERRAAAQMIAHLSVTATKVASAVTTEFEITHSTPRLQGHPLDQPEILYEFGKKERVKAVMAAVKEAVDQRYAWEALVESIGNYKGALNRTNARIASARRRRVKPRTIDTKESARLAAIVAKKTDLRDASQGYYDAMKTIIGLNCPLALLTVDALRPGFELSEFERVFGTAIWELYERLDGLGKGIDPERSTVGQHLAGLPENERGWIDLRWVQDLAVPAEGPELGIINAAVGSLSRDPAWLPMLHEMTWRLLVLRGEITTDSFEYVVMHHYLGALYALLDEMARRQEEFVKFFAVFTKVSAALSVALLVTPLAEAAPALRTVAGLADLAVMAYQISSVVGHLAELDQAIGDKLVQPDAYALHSLGRIGELMFVRRELVGQLPQQLVLELLGIMAAGMWTPVRYLMITRGFVTDMETLLGTDDADE